ncbi:MAG: hypothetical protein IPP91_04845 [Betaproteobacteria bacterium]|nr:hypothetical protein [Betaproteobacteria bacterium]
MAAVTGGTLLAGTSSSAIPSEVSRYGWLNVKDFGAVGDGTHDDTAGLQAAVAAAVKGTEDASVIYVPRGRYLITESNLFGHWNLPSGQGVLGLRVVGDGLRQSILQLNNRSNLDIWFYDDGAVSPSGRGLLFPQFENLRFYGGRRTAGSVSGFRLHPTPNHFPSQGFTFLNCSADGLDTWFDIRGTVNGSENKWLNCRFSGLKTVLRVDQTQAVNQVFLACDFENISGDAFVLGPSGGMPSAITIIGGSVILASPDVEAPSARPSEWAPGRSVSSDDLSLWDGFVYRATGTGVTGTLPPTHRVGTYSDGGIPWSVMKDDRFYFVRFAGTSPISRPLFSASNLKFEFYDSRAKLLKVDHDGNAVQAVFRDCDLTTMAPRTSLDHITRWEPNSVYAEGALVKAGACVYATARGGRSGTFRPQHASGVLGDGGIGDWRFVAMAGTDTIVEIDEPGNQDILFEGCLVPANAAFRVGAPRPGRAGSTFSSYGNITLEHCQIDKRIVDRFSAGSGHSKFLVERCWINEARDSSGSDWMNWALDCNQAGSIGVLNAKGMSTKSVNIHLSWPGPDLPSSDGWLCRVVLPPNALVRNVFVKKLPGRGKGPYQLQVTNDDGSFVYGESQPAEQSAMHNINIPSLLRSVGQAMNERILRLRCAPGRAGQERIDRQDGDYFIVEYL